MNMKGPFPRDARISARIRPETKRLIKKLDHSEADIVEYAAKQLASEPILIEWEIGELDLKINELESELYDLKARRQAKLNRLKCIAPNMIDKDTLDNLLVDSAKNYAQSIFGSRDDFSMDLLDNSLAKQSIMSMGKEWGYDELAFLEEVRKQLEILCHTKLSDI